ncbi:MAG: hypothetical protein WB799_09445 [Candidatus Sulfotelmatobacter sp.]
MNNDETVVARILEFLTGIGLQVKLGASSNGAFLPGIDIRNGVLTIDKSKLLYPGDLLHEAGHLALLPAAERAQVNSDAGSDGGIEMAAIAWSYAAALHLGLPPEFVFHKDGYRGGSDSIIESFAAGRYFGVPILEWAGLTVTKERAQALRIEPYPSMLHWLRER